MDCTIDLGEGDKKLVARPYQVKLEEIALQKNTIIHLPTGSGKTFIAIRLIKRFRDALLPPWGQGGKRTFFLVNNVPLVDQQKKVIKRLCPVEVAGYTGADNVDFWDKAKWDLELTKNQVIVMTSQILSDMITHAYIRLEDINLLIFDECHHAVDDHPMRVIMKHFESCSSDMQPRILGLTATLLNRNAKTQLKVKEYLRSLEVTFHATIATVNELGEVLSYSTNPRESLEFYNTAKVTDIITKVLAMFVELSNKLEGVKLPQVVRNPFFKLKKGQYDISTPTNLKKLVKNIIEDMKLFLSEYGNFGGHLAIVAGIIHLERLRRRSTQKEDDLFLKVAITHCTRVKMIILDAMNDKSGFEKILKYSSPQILKLLEILKEYNPDVYNKPGVVLKFNLSRQPLSGIIFTKQRMTAKILYNLLKEVVETNPKEFGFLKHDFIVGLNANPIKCTREDLFVKKSSLLALLKFSNKGLNCLISTSVVEEGIDISQCMLIVRFDPPEEYRSYIQSKGRARSSDAGYVIMVKESDRGSFTKKYHSYRDTELFIREVLVGSTDYRAAPTQSAIQTELYEDGDIEAYVTENGGRLFSVSAISLLNRYCSMLPHDQFTMIAPMWIAEDVVINKVPKKMVTITMPVSCPVKQVIKGKPHEDIKVAKRSAALEACKLLYEEGELDPITLLPIGYGKVEFENPEIMDCFPNWPNDEEHKDEPKHGTKKRVRKHVKVFPACLNEPVQSKSSPQTFYMHLVHLKVNFDIPEESRQRALYDLLQQKEGFAFLTPNPVPKLCDFPMFLTVGEVIVTLEVNYAVVPLDTKLFNLIKQFHFMLFDQVLEIAKSFVVFDGSKNSLYVVPVKSDDGFDIDWQTLMTYQTIGSFAVPSLEERKAVNVSPESYKHCVVTPWYRGTILPDRYIVSKVLEDMTPQSTFGSDSYTTFASYYSSKYNLEIIGPKDQPLLEVRNIDTRMNCLWPRSSTIKGFTDKQKKLISVAIGDDKPRGFDEVFVPEFCIKYDFPGVLWFKATILPSIIHRVTMLLVAHELRYEIAKDMKYGQTHLNKSETWTPLGLDMEVVKRSMRAQIEDPVPASSIDRINKPSEDGERRSLNIVTMSESVYQLQKNKISKEYPWDESMEPIDIERNILTVKVMDIECYDKFVCMPINEEGAIPTQNSPQSIGNVAILPPPIQYNDKIKILSKKPSARGPELKDILTAITTIKSHDVFDLERCETLGDSFLKFAASLYLHHKFPKLNEGQLTNIKGRLIGNRNLFYAGEKVRLGGRMKVEGLSPRKDFLVPGFFAPEYVKKFIEEKQIRPTFMIGMQFPPAEIASGKLSKKSMEMVKQRFDERSAVEDEPASGVQNAMQSYIGAQAVSDKCIADCVEAIIGTYLLDGGITAAIKILEWFKIIPPKDNFSEYLQRRVSTVITENKATRGDIDHIMNNYRIDVERIMNYKFNDPSFLLEALSHPSYIRNRFTRSYERLEFLGDAILDFLITSNVFENCNNLKPGDLTDLRSSLVNNVTFAAYVVKLGLHKYICSQLNPTLDSAILKFVEHQEQRNHEIVEDVLYFIDEADCHIAEYVEVPKVLSDIFESLIGAIYLDCGGDLATVWRVVYRIMHVEIDRFSKCIPIQPVRVLYEDVHLCPLFHPPEATKGDVTKVMVGVTITNPKTGKVHTLHGFGNNKFQAKRAAAKLALKIVAS